ncbi:MAG: pilin [Plesiomonas sp.]|uniref:pilin n=1 Tax=Plesiomonas sp. TaxID=2486279 RepID=UPI003F336E08
MMNKMKQGFTLIELMIVVAVIGVLAAIAIPQYQNYVAKAEIGAALSTVASMKTNAEDYIASKGSFPTSAVSIGAPVVPNGLVSVTSNLSAITIHLGNSTSGVSPKAQGVYVTMQRLSDESWKCKVTSDATLNTTVNEAITPKGCN